MASKFSRLQYNGRIFWILIILVAVLIVAVYRDHIFSPESAPVQPIDRLVAKIVHPTIVPPGGVEVQTLPSGVQVLIDGEVKGVTPLAIVDLAKGTHILSLRKSCYQSQKQEFAVGDEPVSLHFTMDLICGNLDVDSRPAGSTVFVNGKKRGVTPYSMTGVRLGNLDLHVQHGFTKLRRNVMIRKGYTSKEIFDFHRPTQPEHRMAWQDFKTGLEFVWVKGGCFLMGNPKSDVLLQEIAEREKHKVSSFFKSVFDVVTDSGEEEDVRDYDIDEAPVHEVCLDGIWVGQKEVTNAQYMLFSEATGKKPEWLREGNEYNIETGENEYYQTLGGASLSVADNPVVGVSWRDVTVFSQWFTSETGHPCRLLSEAEWEYVCRSGGQKEEFSGGDEVDDVAWYSDNSDGESHGVGLLQANGLGVFDFSGNVWEWTLDQYHPEAYASHGKFNPVQDVGVGDRRKVVRGGSWRSKQKSLRCTARYGLPSDDTNVFLGFRIVMTGGEE